MGFCVCLSIHNLLGPDVDVESKPSAAFGGIEQVMRNSRRIRDLIQRRRDQTVLQCTEDWSLIHNLFGEMI